jgi:hypothetical protein
MTVERGTIRAAHFSADWTANGQAYRVSMRGNADMAVQEEMRKFLDALHEAVRGARATEVLFEFAELYFMNSSCLSLLLRFINGVVNLPTPERYRIRLKSNPNLRWQRKSLAALHAYARDVVGLE